MRLSLVADHGERRLFVQQLAPERIHHANSAVLHRSHDWRVEALAGHQFIDQHALVDQRHGLSGYRQRAVLILRVARIPNEGVNSKQGEFALEQDEFASRWDLGPVEDDDLRLLPHAAPLMKRMQQRVHN